jgi:hypothetical protein
MVSGADLLKFHAPVDLPGANLRKVMGNNRYCRDLRLAQ